MVQLYCADIMREFTFLIPLESKPKIEKGSSKATTQEGKQEKDLVCVGSLFWADPKILIQSKSLFMHWVTEGTRIHQVEGVFCHSDNRVKQKIPSKWVKLPCRAPKINQNRKLVT